MDGKDQPSQNRLNRESLYLQSTRWLESPTDGFLTLPTNYRGAIKQPVSPHGAPGSVWGIHIV